MAYFHLGKNPKVAAAICARHNIPDSELRRDVENAGPGDVVIAEQFFDDPKTGERFNFYAETRATITRGAAVYIVPEFRCEREVAGYADSIRAAGVFLRPRPK